MSVQLLFTSIGLWAGLKAIRLSWDPRLTRIASIAAFVCGVGFVQSLTPLLLHTMRAFTLGS